MARPAAEAARRADLAPATARVQGRAGVVHGLARWRPGEGARGRGLARWRPGEGAWRCLGFGAGWRGGAPPACGGRIWSNLARSVVGLTRAGLRAGPMMLEQAAPAVIDAGCRD